MKLLKRCIIGFLILIVLTISLVFVVITFYKKNLTNQLTQQLESTYGLRLNVGDLKVSVLSNWPHVSIDLKKTVLLNVSSHSTPLPIIKADVISISFDFIKLLQKEFVVKYLTIKDAEINLIRDTNGVANFEIKKQVIESDDGSSGLKFWLKKISIHKTRFEFKNEKQQQTVSINFVNNTLRLENFSDGVSFQMTGNTIINQLLFNPRAGAFLKNARTKLYLNVSYFYNNKRMCIAQNSNLEIDKEIYKVSSLIDFGEHKRLALFIENNAVKYEKVARLLTPKIQKTLSNFEVKRPFKANALLVVNIGKREEPILLVNIDAKNSDLTIGESKVPYSRLSFNGKIISINATRQHGDMEQARIIFSPIKGLVYGFPFTAKVDIYNLKTPQITIDANLKIDAKKIKFNLEKEFVLNGSAEVTMHYYGLTSKLNRNNFLDDDMHLKANLQMKNLSYRRLNSHVEYVLNGNAVAKNNNLQFDQLNLKSTIGNAQLKGKVNNFIRYVMGFGSSLSATLSATSQRINLNPLLLKKNTTSITKKSTEQNLQKIKQSNFNFNIDLYTKALTIRNVEAQNTIASLIVNDDFIDVKSLTMNTCQGTIFAKGTMENYDKMNAEVKAQNVNVNDLFMAFENFGQTAIKAENLKGNLSFDAKFSASLDKNMEVIGETMLGEVKLKLKEGHLINFEPILNLSNFLFKNRDFNDVMFTDLHERFTLKGFEMNIEELEIASNVLNLYVVNGIYNFKGNSNVNILIPWSNLKRRAKNHIPKNIGTDAENVRGLKLNYSGPAKKMKISLGHRSLN